MNWGLVPPQMAGLLLFLLLAVLSLIPVGLGVFWILYQINKSRNSDLDEQIRRVAQAENRTLDQRLTSLQNAQDSQHRETMSMLEAMEKRLPTRDNVSAHDNKLGQLELRVSTLEKQVDAAFDLVRKQEMQCVRNSAGVGTEAPTTCGGRP